MFFLLLLKYNRTYEWANWISLMLFRQVPYMSNEGKSDNCAGQGTCQTSCWTRWVAWALCAQTYFCNRTSPSYCRKGSRTGWTMFWKKMALFNGPSINIKDKWDLELMAPGIRGWANVFSENTLCKSLLARNMLYLHIIITCMKAESIIVEYRVLFHPPK